MAAVVGRWPQALGVIEMAVVRPARPGDYGRLILLWRDSAAQSHPFISTAYWDDLVEEMRLKRLPLSKTLVAEADCRIVGFISTLDEWIIALYVDPASQRQGIGRALLDRVKAEAAESLVLEVFAENARGVSFYRSQGFLERDSREDSSGHALRVMEWKQ